MQTSRWLGLLTTVLIGAVPALILFGLATGAFTVDALIAGNPTLNIVTPPGAGAVTGYVLIEALLMAVGIYVLWQVRALFGAYAAGDILTLESAQTLQRAGGGLLALAGCNIVATAVQGVLLTWANPPGQRQLAVGISNTEIWFLLTGGLLMVVGWALVEAARQADENRGFV
ncbi:hypothetical protein [Jannaschia pohangensis]|nr:hypothetical protein [Jannaschia pohangensis]